MLSSRRDFEWTKTFWLQTFKSRKSCLKNLSKDWIQMIALPRRSGWRALQNWFENSWRRFDQPSPSRSLVALAVPICCDRFANTAISIRNWRITPRVAEWNGYGLWTRLAIRCSNLAMSIREMASGVIQKSYRSSYELSAYELRYLVQIAMIEVAR